MKPAFCTGEIETVQHMHAAGCSLAGIAAFLGRSKSGVARYIPAPDARNRWDAPPSPDRSINLRTRWEARLPAMREAMRNAGAQQ